MNESEPDACRSLTSAQPVSVGREAQRVDDVTALQGVQVFAVVEIPQHGFAVATTAGAQRTVGRDGDGVDVRVVTVVVGAKFAVRQVPNLNECTAVRSAKPG